MTQDEALHILKLGHNVYLTGSAGSGKTHLLNRYIAYLQSHHVPVAVTASTGIAATHLGGMTIHSWSGLGIRDHLSREDMSALEERKYLHDRFRDTKVLIIDEISMLHHFRLDLVENIVRTFRHVSKPFGGLQVILSGDFFQLPPVSRMGDPEPLFVYHSEAWNTMNLKVCYLHEQHRQSDDACIRVLNDIRGNTVSESTLMPLRRRYKKDPTNTIPPTKLYTHHVDVDAENEREIEKLPGKEKIFEMTSKGRGALLLSLKKSCLAPERLRLKVGAQVMFVKNNREAGYVNGTLGKIVAFDEEAPIVETAKGERIFAGPATWTIEEDGKMKAEITQVPLCLAWAITVHKSQGMSLDAVEVDLSKSFEKGMGYVALSRVRTLGGLKLLGLNKIAMQVNDEVLEFDKDLQRLSEEARNTLKTLHSDDLARLQKEYLAKITTEKNTKKPKTSTYEETKKLLAEKLTLREMAARRKLSEGTILEHLEKLTDEGRVNPRFELAHLKPPSKRFGKIAAAFRASGDTKLTPVRAILGETYHFEELRLARLFL